MSLHDSDSSIGPEPLDSSEDESNSLNYKLRPNSTYVIVEYEGEYFPGLVKNKKYRKAEVSVMPMSLKNWKWP